MHRITVGDYTVEALTDGLCPIPFFPRAGPRRAPRRARLGRHRARADRRVPGPRPGPHDPGRHRVRPARDRLPARSRRPRRARHQRTSTRCSSRTCTRTTWAGWRRRARRRSLAPGSSTARRTGTRWPNGSATTTGAVSGWRRSARPGAAARRPDPLHRRPRPGRGGSPPVDDRAEHVDRLELHRLHGRRVSPGQPALSPRVPAPNSVHFSGPGLVPTAVVSCVAEAWIDTAPQPPPGGA